ncbi:DUF1772 domain-containing protein [Devosia algicola]|uniref:DUF1772 domain-containing protein n=1 Tax=Devosia algicola TaxID=3026418 RepID=A0ABY7YPS7_9HYPH|nr:anthrone oxygenase family protein [Devosia algicola]WDR03039.1 DUF1772 domain-containing protein [Devosia algicola]
MTAQPQFLKIPPLLTSFAFLSLVLCGAIFGFFYAWICSTMWGLDTAEPTVAIAAMQAMNASVRNAVFAPAFFGTPVILFLTAWLSQTQRRKLSAWAFLAAGIVYLIGGLGATMVVNVPMNEALALVEIPQSTQAAQQIWTDYSAKWQVWNIARTVASGISLALIGFAFLHLKEV